MPRPRWPEGANEYLDVTYGLKMPAEICDDIARMFGYVVNESALNKQAARRGLACDRHGVSISAASRELGISHSAVRYLIEKRGIQTYGTGCRRYIPEHDMAALRSIYQRARSEHLTVKEAAALVGLSKSQVLNLIAQGVLRVERSGRLILVFRWSAEGLLKRRTCSYRRGRYVNVPFYRMARRPGRPIHTMRFWAPVGGFRVTIKGLRYYRECLGEAHKRIRELERLEGVVKSLLGAGTAAAAGQAIAKLKERAGGTATAGPPVKIVVQNVVAPRPAVNPEVPPGPPSFDDDDDPSQQWRPRRVPLCVSCIYATKNEEADLGYVCALRQNVCQPLGAGNLYKKRQ